MKNAVITYSIILLFSFSVGFVYSQENITKTSELEMLNDKGKELSASGKHYEAIKIYNKALEIDPNFTKALHNIGLELERLGKHNEALTWYDKALNINPNITITLKNKGELFFELDRYNEALQVYNKLLEIEPNSTYALNNKGVILSNLGQQREALDLYDKVLEIDPSDVTALLNKNELEPWIDTFSLSGQQDSEIKPKLEKAKIILTGQTMKESSTNYEKALGEVKNIGNASAKYVKLIYTFYDENGEFVGKDIASTDIDEIKPGQKSTFDALIEKENIGDSTYFEIALTWDNPDGTVEYLEDVGVTKDDKKLPDELFTKNDSENVDSIQNYDDFDPGIGSIFAPQPKDNNKKTIFSDKKKVSVSIVKDASNPDTDLDYYPNNLEVKKKTKITWINDDNTSHTVTSTDDKFDSGVIASGDDFTFKFKKSGEYKYSCTIHPFMKGEINVRN